jgi:hypothetical protein
LVARMDLVSPRGRVALVTGGPRGIGRMVAAIHMAPRAGDYAIGETIAVDGGAALADAAGGA